MPFARALVNSGRLSTASTLHGSPLNTADVDAFDGAMVPGAPALDAPLRCDGRDGWLLRHARRRRLRRAGVRRRVGSSHGAGLRQAAEGLLPLQVLLVASSESVRLPGARTVVDCAG